MHLHYVVLHCHRLNIQPASTKINYTSNVQLTLVIVMSVVVMMLWRVDMDWNMEDVTELLFILAINNSPTHLRSSILEKMSKSSNENPEADSFRSKNCSIIIFISLFHLLMCMPTSYLASLRRVACIWLVTLLPSLSLEYIASIPIAKS